MVDIGLDHLVGAIATDGVRQYCTVISPADIRLRSIVCVLEPGDVLYKSCCPPGLSYLFEKSPGQTNYTVHAKSICGKSSPYLFCTVEY